MVRRSARRSCYPLPRYLPGVVRSRRHGLSCCDDNAGSVRYGGIHAAPLLALFVRPARLFTRGDSDGARTRDTGNAHNLVRRRDAYRRRPRSGAGRCRPGHPASSRNLPRPCLRRGGEHACSGDAAAPVQPDLRAARAKPRVAVGRSSLEATKGLRRSRVLRPLERHLPGAARRAPGRGIDR